jgi:excisionase family DNA binding protein
MALLTTKEIAARLSVSVRRVHQLIEERRLPAEKMGRDYFIKEEDLKLVKVRKVGRPPKPKEEEGTGSKKRGGRK